MGGVRHEVESKPILVLPCPSSKSVFVPGLVVDFECLDRPEFASDGEFATHLFKGGVDEFHGVWNVCKVACVGKNA